MSADQASCCLCVLKELLGAPWLQNLILAVSAIIGILTISSSSRNEKRRATVDIVRDQTTDLRLRAARQRYRNLRNNHANFAALINDQTSEDFLAVREVMNAYEFMAAGVRENAFDEKTYKRMYFSNVVTDWKTLVPLVAEYRKQRGNTLYQEFEWLASRWNQDPLEIIN